MRATICLPDQTLSLYDDLGQLRQRYPVSTGLRGCGEQRGSQCTPRGAHVVRARIGAGAEPATVFVHRRPTDEIWSPQLAAEFPERDWILTRILWLSGRRPGFNRLGAVDTMRRYIYIHGTPDSEPMGTPASHGCVRMRNSDIIPLFDALPVGSRVELDDFRVITGHWEVLKAHAAVIRTRVFVEEQGVPAELEMDAIDPECVHALALDDDGQALGTGRLLPDGHVGRMAVLASARGRGIGRALLDALHEVASERGMTSTVLNAQTHATDFYRRFGYVDEGAPFFEAGLPHLCMRRTVVPPSLTQHEYRTHS
jgi:predicted GNAT family N-acyltransferase